MARRRKKKSQIGFLRWGFLALVLGGGIGVYLNPELPFIGPLVARLNVPEVVSPQALQTEGEKVVESLSAVISNGESDDSTGANATRGLVIPQTSTDRKPADRIRIATFNIQIFGQSKIGKPDVVEILAQIVRRYDLVAIQEIRTKKDTLLPTFINKVNEAGGNYDFLIGPRIGRTISTEQYAYIYDASRIEYDPSSIGTMSDPNDLLHREPYVVRFRAKTPNPEDGFTFWLVNIHTDPDEVPEEIDALADAFQAMQTARADEDDVILLGDLNADERKFGRLGRIPGMSWVVMGNVMTNARKNHAYDNILFERGATSEYLGNWGVLDMETIYGLSREQTLKVSDHLPVWADFDLRESR